MLKKRNMKQNRIQFHLVAYQNVPRFIRDSISKKNPPSLIHLYFRFNSFYLN